MQSIKFTIFSCTMSDLLLTFSIIQIKIRISLDLNFNDSDDQKEGIE